MKYLTIIMILPAILAHEACVSVNKGQGTYTIDASGNIRAKK